MVEHKSLAILGRLFSNIKEVKLDTRAWSNCVDWVLESLKSTFDGLRCSKLTTAGDNRTVRLAARNSLIALSTYPEIRSDNLRLQRVTQMAGELVSHIEKPIKNAQYKMNFVSASISINQRAVDYIVSSSALLQILDAPALGRLFCNLLML